MKKGTKFITCLFLIFLFSEICSQTYIQDTLAVRAILDSNHLYDISVSSVSNTDKATCRIIQIVIKNLGITKIPQEIGKLSKLKSLRLNTNKIVTLPSEIGDLKNLKEFDLGGNSIIELPPEFGNLTGLAFLKLDNNLLQKLPPWFGNLTNLYGLSLNSNLLEELPPEIGNLSLLLNFSAFGNKLKNIPTEFGTLRRLMACDFSHNKLDDIPVTIGGLSNLKIFKLTGNNLNKLPSSIGKLKKLQLLFLSDNLITELPNEIGRLSSLKGLYLSQNKIENIPDKILELNELEELTLKNNPLVFPVNNRVNNDLRTAFSYLINSIYGINNANIIYEPLSNKWVYVYRHLMRLVFLSEDNTGYTTYNLNNDTLEKLNILPNNAKLIKCNMFDYFVLTQEGDVYKASFGADSLAVQINSIQNIVDIQIGTSSYTALTKDSSVWICPFAGKGSQVNGLDGISSILLGFALKSDGTVWSLDRNKNDDKNTPISKYVPVRIEGLKNIIQIAGDRGFVLALDKEGGVWSWGHNVDGQLGLKTKKKHVTKPMKIKKLRNIVKVFAGYDRSFCVNSNNILYGWGSNALDAIEPRKLVKYNDIISQQADFKDVFGGIVPSPIKINKIKNIEYIIPGGIGVVAYCSDGVIINWGL